MKIRNFNLDAFTRAYLIAALWSSNDESTPDGGEPMNHNYDLSDLADSALQKACDDCAKFQAEQGRLLTEENCSYRGCAVLEYAGHDFWLTRNGHGCGFWDGDWSESSASILTKAAESFGQIDLYVGDDNLIYS